MRYFISLSILVCLFNCTERDYPQKFPILFTLESIVIAEGVQFNGTIESLGTGQKIVRYGFVYDETTNPTINSSYTVVAGEPKKGAFSKIINNDLAKEKKYFVRAFIQTDKSVIYGDEQSFTSQGSKPPIIQNFNPQSGFDGTQVTIRGKNFSSKAKGNKVLLGTVLCEVLSASDTLVTIKIPTSPFIGDYSISIEVAGNKGISSNPFSILGPRIKTLSKMSGRVGDPISFTGEYFTLSSYLNIYFGPPQQWVTNYANYIVSSDNSMISFVPDYPNKTGQIQISSTVNNTQKTFVFPDNFTIINSWNKLSGTSPLDKFSGYRSAQISNLIYVIGGKTLYEYNILTNAYTKKADFPGEYRFYGSAFSHNGLLYFGFGEGAYPPPSIQSSNGKYYNDLWVYSPTEDKWSLVGNSSMTGRSRVSPLVINDKVYFGFGWKYGINANNLHSDLWEFDLNSKIWKQLPSPPFTNKGPDGLAFQISDNCYFVGQDYTSNNAFLWQYNTTAQLWTKKADYPQLLYGETALLYNNHGMVLSYPNGSSLTLVYEYDPALNYWIKRQSASARTTAFQFAQMYNGKLIYVAGSQWAMEFE